MSPLSFMTFPIARFGRLLRRTSMVGIVVAAAALCSAQAANADPVAGANPTHVAAVSSHAIPRVTAIGDSVMLDAAPNLRARGITVDAVVGQQVSSGISEVRRLNHDGRLGRTVVFALGTNGTFDTAEFRQLVRDVHGRHLVVVTSHCGYCSWRASNNAMVHHRCTTRAHCTVADWNSLADRHPGWFGSDGVHMPIGGVGAHHYANLIASRA